MGKLKLRKLSPASQGQFNDQVSQLISSASSLPSQDTSIGSRCAGKAGKEGPGTACGDSGVLSEAPGTHTPAMFIHSSCSWKGLSRDWGSWELQRQTHTPVCLSRAASLKEIRVTRVGPPWPLNSAAGDPARVWSRSPGASTVRWHFTGFASQTQPRQPHPTCFSLSFPIPARKGLCMLPAASARNLLQQVPSRPTSEQAGNAEDVLLPPTPFPPPLPVGARPAASSRVSSHPSCPQQGTS